MMQDESRTIHVPWPMRDLVYRLLDAGAILLTLVAVLSWTGQPSAEPYLLVGAAALAAHYLIAELTGAYRSWRGVGAEREVLCVGFNWALAVPAIVTLGYTVGLHGNYDRQAMLMWFVATLLALVASRSAVRSVQQMLRARGVNIRRFAIVGVNSLGVQLARNIEASPELGLVLAGFYDDRPKSRLPDLPDEVGQRVGDLSALVEACGRREVDTIYITFPMRAEARIRSILERLSDTTASVYIVPDFFVFELLHSRWTSINGLPAVSVFENPLYGAGGMLKRAMDLGLAIALLAMLAVPMLVIAAAIKLTSPGPVFFRQKRYGLDGREIGVWKFRSMRVCEDGAAVQQATKGDPRVTRVGGFLRSTSLDELPQLFNVLEGTMSLVGPRPLASKHNEQYRRLVRGYMLRHKIKPGMTGLAQVCGWRGEVDTLEKLENRIRCDHQYIREWSLWLDLRILFRTFFVVFSRQNAY